MLADLSAVRQSRPQSETAFHSSRRLRPLAGADLCECGNQLRENLDNPQLRDAHGCDDGYGLGARFGHCEHETMIPQVVKLRGSEESGDTKT